MFRTLNRAALAIIFSSAVVYGQASQPSEPAEAQSGSQSQGQTQATQQPSQAPSEAQPQSLGDIARQARAQKAAAQSAAPSKVVTNDSFHTSSSVLSSQEPAFAAPKGTPGNQAAATAGLAGPASSSNAAAFAQARATFDRLDALLNQVQGVSDAALVSNVLGANNVDFPGREEWERKLFAARQMYVSRTRELARQGRQFVDAAQQMDSQHVSESDPRGKALMAQVQGFVQQCVETNSEFRAVVLEGQDMASRATGSAAVHQAN